MCTNLTLQGIVCAYLLQGNFLLYLERFWPSLHVHYLMDFGSHVLEGCFSAEEAWPDCWGLLEEGQWARSDQHTPLPDGNDLCHSPASLGVLHHHPCMSRTRWHQRIPAELQPPGSAQAPVSKAAQACGGWHLLKVNSDGSIFFLMLWKQLHVTEAFKMLPFL